MLIFYKESLDVQLAITAMGVLFCYKGIVITETTIWMFFFFRNIRCFEQACTHIEDAFKSYHTQTSPHLNRGDHRIVKLYHKTLNHSPKEAN